MSRREKGSVLPAVIIFTMIFAIIGLTLLAMAEQETVLTRIDADKLKAFYIAEAGLAKLSETLQSPGTDEVPDPLEGSTELGSFSVELSLDTTPCYAIATGASGLAEKRIRVEPVFLAGPFDHCIYALNVTGGNWAFSLRGTGNPVWSGGRERGGKDLVNGNVFIDGDIRLYQESRVNPAPAPNTYNLGGDVDATGNIVLGGTSSISGESTPFADEPPPIDLIAMHYEEYNTHNVGQIFQDAGVGAGHLPSGHELRNIFTKNPSDRASECASTPGNDYFLEPASGFLLGSQTEGRTPLNVGMDRIYYVDGDVWVHSKMTYGFKLEGRVTIVATGNIHVSDNIQYKDSSSLLGLIALGKYDSGSQLVSGGNIYFGDPRYGTTYTVGGLMFAANNFLYNTDSVTNEAAEPTTGFSVFGTFAAMNRVSVERDWYTQRTTGRARPARFNWQTNTWVDAISGVTLTSTETNSIRHYRMSVSYDDRVRSPATQPPGLPRGSGTIFAGFRNWEELG